MITEIVFRNILTDLGPAEISALLSCLVVEARIKLKTQQILDKKLEDRIIEIQYVDKYLSDLENQFDVGIDDPLAQADRLNFGLVQVVYEWAQGKPFSEIIKITNVQEGIIVHSIQKLHEVIVDCNCVDFIACWSKWYLWNLICRCWWTWGMLRRSSVTPFYNRRWMRLRWLSKETLCSLRVCTHKMTSIWTFESEINQFSFKFKCKYLKILQICVLICVLWNNYYFTQITFKINNMSELKTCEFGYPLNHMYFFVYFYIFI